MASAKTAAPALGDVDVKKLVHAWHRAQNDADFSSYEALYAERFTGVKRSGNRTRSFGRSAWLADRKTMFEKPMQVGVSPLSITLSGPTARVEFEQTWSSGTYSDSGRKQMVIAATPEGPRIVREEMLESKLAGASVLAVLADFVLTDEDGLVLDTKPDDRWSKGNVRPGRHPHVATTEVNEGALPAALSSFKGKSVRALAKSGAVCTATVTSFVLRTEVVPHFGMLEYWSGRSEGPALSKEAIAGEIWKLGADHGRSLVGELSPPCDALWALPADKGAPSSGAMAPAGAELTALGVEALRKHPRHAELQKEYVANVAGAQGPWDKMPEALVRAFTLELGGRPKLLHVSVSAMSDGCNEFVGALDAVFEMGPGEKPRLTLVGVPESPNGSTWTPESVFDLDGDGALEILFSGGFSRTRALYTKGQKGHELRVLFQVPYFDCPC